MRACVRARECVSVCGRGRVCVRVCVCVFACVRIWFMRAKSVSIATFPRNQKCPTKCNVHWSDRPMIATVMIVGSTAESGGKTSSSSSSIEPAIPANDISRIIDDSLFFSRSDFDETEC